jgi:hypothetical protein
VALASTVATKLTSAVFSFAKSFWGRPASPAQEKEVKVEKAVSLSLKYFLSDANRCDHFLSFSSLN